MGNKNLKNIILTGLDGSGLTTILNYYNKGFFFKSSITKIPAIGINVETMELNNLKFFKFGVGAYRNKLDLEYTSIADAIIFVINSEKDEENSVIKFIEHTKVYLHSLLNDNSMKNCPFLILTGLPVLPIASMKSVCLHRNAGIWIISKTFAALSISFIE